MFPYTPVAAQPRPVMGRAVASLSETTPPPPPDTIFTGFVGIPGVFETLAILTITGAAAWSGIRTGMGDGSRALRTAGWIGGIGSAVLGLLYIGGRTALAPSWLPAVRVTPS